MLRELFESIVSQAHKSKETQIREVDDGQSLLIFNGSDQTYNKHWNLKRVSGFGFASTDIESFLTSIESFQPVAIATSDRFANVAAEIDGAGTIMVAPLGSAGNYTVASCLLDNRTRADRLTLDLERTEQFDRLASLDESFNQRNLLKFLRVDLRQAGAENVVQSSVDIPEEITITVPVFTSPSLAAIEVTFTLVVQVDFQNQQIQLTVPPTEAQKAKQYVRQAIYEKILKATKDNEKLTVVMGE